MDTNASPAVLTVRAAWACRLPLPDDLAALAEGAGHLFELANDGDVLWALGLALTVLRAGRGSQRWVALSPQTAVAAAANGCQSGWEKFSWKVASNGLTARSRALPRSTQGVSLPNTFSHTSTPVPVNHAQHTSSQWSRSWRWWVRKVLCSGQSHRVLKIWLGGWTSHPWPHDECMGPMARPPGWPSDSKKMGRPSFFDRLGPTFRHGV